MKTLLPICLVALLVSCAAPRPLPNLPAQSQVRMGLDLAAKGQFIKAEMQFRLAAEAGYSSGMFYLGMMQFMNDEPLRDRIQSYGWLSAYVAQERAPLREMAQNTLEDLKGILTLDELGEEKVWAAQLTSRFSR